MNAVDRLRQTAMNYASDKDYSPGIFPDDTEALARIERLVEACKRRDRARKARDGMRSDISNRQRRPILREVTFADDEYSQSLAAVLGGNEVADLSLHDKKEG